MLQSIKKDSILSFLLKYCSLTETQLDTILISRTDGNLRNKTALRDKRKVSEGAFLRTMRQGQENIESSIYTVLMLNYLGLVSPEDVERLVRSSQLISKVRESAPTAEAVDRLVQALKDLAEGLSGRRGQRLIV